MFDIIAFDADDTLWHTEQLYSMTQAKFVNLLSSYHSQEWIEERLYAIEMRNLHSFGYGIKGFTLSMIETAIELTQGQIQGKEIQSIIDFARDMLKSPIQVIDQVEDVITSLAQTYQLMIITKGDLFDQETKIARSGLGGYFAHVEILSDKTADSYTAVLRKHRINPQRFLMVGNSIRSDIVPVVAIGGQAVHIPYHMTWVHETVSSLEQSETNYYELEHIGLLPDLIKRLTAESACT